MQRLRAPIHLAARGLLYSVAALTPLVALYALFDAADHGLGAALPTISRLLSIASQVAPVAACLGAVAAATVAASRGELRALAALGVRSTRPGIWVGAGAVLVASLGSLARADLSPRIARAWSDARPDPGAMAWAFSNEPGWIRSSGATHPSPSPPQGAEREPAGDALVRCANATCTEVWSATATGIERRAATRSEQRAFAARSPAPAMRLTASELVTVADVRRAAGLPAIALDVELWLRISLAALAMLLPFGAASLVASRPSRARTTAFVVAGSVAVVGLAVAATAQGATAGAWPAWLPMIPALGTPAALWLWAEARARRA